MLRRIWERLFGERPIRSIDKALWAIFRELNVIRHQLSKEPIPDPKLAELAKLIQSTGLDADAIQALINKKEK